MVGAQSLSAPLHPQTSPIMRKGATKPTENPSPLPAVMLVAGRYNKKPVQLDGTLCRDSLDFYSKFCLALKGPNFLPVSHSFKIRFRTYPETLIMHYFVWEKSILSFPIAI